METNGEVGVRVKEELELFAVLEEEDVSSPADDRVDRGAFDGEADPHPVQRCGVDSFQDAPHHFAVHFLEVVFRVHEIVVISIRADSKGA